MRPRRPPIDEDEKDRDFVVALARGLEVLRAFRKESDALGNKDFAARTGLSRTTVSRLTYTLHRLGYLSYDANTARYRLAPPVLALGFSCLAGMSIREVAKPYMQSLADYSDLPVALAGRDRLTMVYLERCRSESAITLAIEVGAHIKLATSALGKAYIATLNDRDRLSLMREIEDHEGPNWSLVRKGIEDGLKCFQTNGYCMSLGAWKADVNAVAVPFVPKDGSPTLVFNCGGPTAQLSQERIVDDVGPRLIDLVRQVAAVSR